MDGGVTINFPTVDWTQLVPQLIGLFLDGIGQWLSKAEHSTVDGVWGSSANVFAQTPMDKTWNFGPINAQLADVQSAARAVLIFALEVLGLKSMVGAISRRHADTIGEFIDGAIMAAILVTAFPLVIPQLIGLVNDASRSVANGASLSAYVSAADGVDNPLVQAVLWLILAFFAIRLLLKSIWRIGYLAVLLPIGPLACALYALPQTRWMLGWWARVWGGMLAAQVPSVLALSIGLGMASGGGGGFSGFLYSIAFLQLATDVYSLIPFGSVHHGGPPWAGLPQLTRLWPAASGAAAAASAAPLTNRQVQGMMDYGYR